MANLEKSSNGIDDDSSPDNKQIWVQSALEKGFVDTKDGIKLQNDSIEKKGGLRKRKRAVLYSDVETPSKGSRNRFISNRSTRWTRRGASEDAKDENRGDKVSAVELSEGAQTSRKRGDGEENKEEEEEVETWTCTHCSAIHSTEKIRCGQCKYYREGFSKRKKRAMTPPKRPDGEEIIEVNDDDKEEVNTYRFSSRERPRRAKISPQRYGQEMTNDNGEEKLETWECTHCSSIHSVGKRRCGKCNHYREGFTQRSRRAQTSPGRDDDEESIEMNDEEEEEEEEEEADTWQCTHCSMTHSVDKKRCGKCKHYRNGYGPNRDSGSTSEPPKRVQTPPQRYDQETKNENNEEEAETWGHSPRRRRKTRSASPKRKSTRTPSHESKVVSTKGDWECCETVYTSDRRRCSVCMKWKGGKINSEGSADMDLPSGIELKTSPQKNRCKVLGCNKRWQMNNDGFCRRHYNLIVLGKETSLQKDGPKVEQSPWVCDCGNEIDWNKRRCMACFASRDRGSAAPKSGSGVKVENAEEVIVLDGNESASDTAQPQDCVSKCKMPGCNAQKSSKGMCRMHHRQSIAKYDSVKRAKRHSSSKIRGSDVTPQKGDANDRNLRRSGRAFTPSPKIRHLDYRSDSSIEIVSPSKRGRKRSRSGDEKEKTPTPKKKHIIDEKLRCKFEGCTKFKQPGKKGYCWAHFQRNCISAKREDNGNDDDNKIESSQIVDTIRSSSPSKKKAKVMEVLPLMKTKSPLKKLNSSDSLVFSVSENRQSDKSSYNTFKEGDMVKIDGLVLARVLKVGSDVGSETYHIMKILGGREQIVDAKRLSIYRIGTLVSHSVFDAPRSDIRPFQNTHAMLEMTRYNLLRGQDCWICTSCSVIVPSLTMSCGVCNMHPSFVPLEIKEFEHFVRDQRKKQNHLWLRKKHVSDQALERGIIPSAHLCKFQGCVQPSQISYDGYCECHVNAADLVREKDRTLTNSYMFYLYQQWEPIILTESDLLNTRHKDKNVGDAGLACKHCHDSRKFPKDGELVRIPYVYFQRASYT